MGSGPSKFRKHLLNGDEYMAIQLFNSRSDLHKHLDPNASYGDNYDHNTPMHYAAKYAMKSLLRIFLAELGGNPNKRNIHNETILHCLCNCSEELTSAQRIRRIECLLLVLQWIGPLLHDGNAEKANLAAKDEKENTPLHYAATSGLSKMVELLVNQNAPLFVENLQKETPCDCAEKSNHNNIAVYLESKMVFSNDDKNSEDLEAINLALEENYSGLRAQDLQEAKDQLLVETSDMLNVPLFTAEVLLRNHEWSREILLEAWIRDPLGCCSRCSINPPGSALHGQNASSNFDLSPNLELQTSPTHLALKMKDCGICTFPIDSCEIPVIISCGHFFCRSCWEIYLSRKIQEGDAYNIMCPAYECNMLVDVEIIETLVSRDMARRYLQFDIKAFVESNPSIKWCPNPECGRAVRLPEADALMSPSRQTSFNFISHPLNQQQSETSKAVDCGNGHTFCWDCLGEAHEPASCYNWNNWFIKISEIKPEELTGMEEDTENSANCLWLVTNSKPCPNCKSPIQKNEGCNHMKCSKCKSDFCWVCLEPWKRHSTATGGYFRCNRYEAVKKIEEQQDALKADAEVKNKKLQELNRFVHYYSRFKNHENSYKLEVPLFMTAKEKMLILARAVPSTGSDVHEETKFVEDAVIQLLKARHILKCSYVYGYYLEETGYRKPIFEFMQTELEECTEVLSEMVARPYLRTPRHKIVQAAYLVQRKRHEFVSAISKGLIPPDNSPSRRKKKMFTFNLNDDQRKVLLASLNDDPSNMWVKDSSGRHGNVAALLDWPEESDESDPEITSPSRFPTALGSIAGRSSGAHASIFPGIEPQDLDSVDIDMTCARSECMQMRARNPRTGQLHEHCSMRCMKMDRLERQQTGNASTSDEYVADYHLELLRALEMSRLQYIQELEILNINERSPSISPCTPRINDRRPLISDSPNLTDLAIRHASETNFDTKDEDCNIALTIELPTKNHDYSVNPDIPLFKNINLCVQNASSSTENYQTFGPIKHLSITNINFNSPDKTETFLSKDMTHLFKKKIYVENLKLMEDQYDERNICTCGGGASFYSSTNKDDLDINNEDQSDVCCCDFKFEEKVVNIGDPLGDHKSRSRHISPLQFSDLTTHPSKTDQIFIQNISPSQMWNKPSINLPTSEILETLSPLETTKDIECSKLLPEEKMADIATSSELNEAQHELLIDSKVIESLLGGFNGDAVSDAEEPTEHIDQEQELPSFYFQFSHFENKDSNNPS